VLLGFMSLGVAQGAGLAKQFKEKYVLLGFMSLGVAQPLYEEFTKEITWVLLGFMSLGVAQVSHLQVVDGIIGSASWLCSRTLKLSTLVKLHTEVKIFH